MQFRYFLEKNELFANSGDPDQMQHSAASELGPHCLPVTLLGISRLKSIRFKHFPSMGQG